ncbi:hypothetical protein P43SY_010740 [Pythium insidiosum]|uniref:Uncharacterized protein n=1 Tax=Pythium insidiosum TaxID=114742 RepID=A0AAD5Q569_PYTIN|nr:hypothetical protein P43SY_010740 [Pythium insidiosum]
MSLLERMQAAARQQAERPVYSDVDELREFIDGMTGAGLDYTHRVTIRMRFADACQDKNGCRLTFISDAEQDLEAILKAFQVLDESSKDKFAFRVLVWGARIESISFVQGQLVTMSNIYNLQHYSGKSLSGTVRRADVPISHS